MQHQCWFYRPVTFRAHPGEMHTDFLSHSTHRTHARTHTHTLLHQVVWQSCSVNRYPNLLQWWYKISNALPCLSELCNTRTIHLQKYHKKHSIFLCCICRHQYLMNDKLSLLPFKQGLIILLAHWGPKHVDFHRMNNTISRPTRIYFTRWLICTNTYDSSKPQWQVGLWAGLGVTNLYEWGRTN